jgi:hypothetical protein
LVEEVHVHEELHGAALGGLDDEIAGAEEDAEDPVSVVRAEEGRDEKGQAVLGRLCLLLAVHPDYRGSDQRCP